MTLLRCTVEDTPQGTLDLAWSLTRLPLHFVMALEILSGNIKEEFLLAA